VFRSVRHSGAIGIPLLNTDYAPQSVLIMYEMRLSVAARQKCKEDIVFWLMTLLLQVLRQKKQDEFYLKLEL